MISKNKKKFLTSLQQKKYRKKHNVFIGEGHKINLDLLTAKIKCVELYATEEWIGENSELLPENVISADIKELKGISKLISPPPVVGVYEIEENELAVSSLKNTLAIALDGVQDPGNMGTILRIADWFGINHVICSEDTADTYNPKVVQATMGAIARVKVHYVDLPEFIDEYQKVTGLSVYGTFLEGENIYGKELSSRGLIVMGNEGKGISAEIEKMITEKLYIPNFPPDARTSESLNVSVATAIVCSEFRRRELIK